MEQEEKNLSIEIDAAAWPLFKAAFRAAILGLQQRANVQARLWHLLVGLLAVAVLFYYATKKPECVGEMPYETAKTSMVSSVDTSILQVALEADDGCAPIGIQTLEAGVTKGADPRMYIQRFARVARIEMKRYGIPASISLAQGLIESRAGTSRLAKNANNHFGIKCFSKKCKAGHCMNASDDHHKDFFRKFGAAWDSWRAHSELLANGRYRRLKKYGRDYRKWAQGLEQLGYATDRTYAEKLVGVIEKYDLHRYDK